MAAGSQVTASVVDKQQADSSRFAALGSKLSEYYDAMQGEPLNVQAQECDFLIESVADSVLRRFVAQDIYKHYLSSSLMGAENVAVHVFDKWFATGLIDMQSREAFQDAQVYADFNRQSLLGKNAPQLMLQTPDGQPFTLHISAGQYAVLYFYDTDCAKCKLESILLSGLLNSNEYPIRLYAIYVGDNRPAWDSYLKDYLTVNAGSAGVTHLWDPTFESDFQRKYGVTQTPRMFLVAPDGVILGRGLDTEALGTMLNDLFVQKESVYGTKESEVLFDGIFSIYEGVPSAAQVMGIADYISDKTLQAGDTVMFKQLAGDYLYYLSTRSGEGFKEGLRYHIEHNINSQSSVWTSKDDSLKVVGFADIMYNLLSKAVPGSKVPALKVPGELYDWRKAKNLVKRLDRLPGRENIIIFYTEGCEVCAAEKSAALALLSKSHVVFMVNVDWIVSEDPSLAARLMDIFDLSSLPYIIITDSEGTILRRYATVL